MGHHTEHPGKALAWDQLSRRSRAWVRQQNDEDGYGHPSATSLVPLLLQPEMSPNPSDVALRTNTIDGFADNDSALALSVVPPFTEDDLISSNTLGSKQSPMLPSPAPDRIAAISQLRDRIRFEGAARRLCQASPELAAQNFDYAVQLAKRQHFARLRSINQEHKRTMREFQVTQRMVDRRRMQHAVRIRKRSLGASHKNNEDGNTPGRNHGMNGLPIDASTLGHCYSEDFKDHGEEDLNHDFSSDADSDSDESDDEDVNGDYLYASTETTETATL